MSVERISSISPTVAGSLWLCGWILTLQKSITQEKTEQERLYSTIGFLLAALKRLGRLWPSLNAVYRTPAPEHQTAEASLRCADADFENPDILETITNNFPESMTFSDICLLLEKWNRMCGKAQTDATCPLTAVDHASKLIYGTPTEPETTTNHPLWENCCDNPSLDVGFDTRVFSTDLWPTDNFSFFGSVFT